MGVGAAVDHVGDVGVSLPARAHLRRWLPPRAAEPSGYQPISGCPSGCPSGHHECDIGQEIPPPDPCQSGCLTLGGDRLRYCVQIGQCVSCGRVLDGVSR